MSSSTDNHIFFLHPMIDSIAIPVCPLFLILLIGTYHYCRTANHSEFYLVEIDLIGIVLRNGVLDFGGKDLSRNVEGR